MFTRSMLALSVLFAVVAYFAGDYVTIQVNGEVMTTWQSNPCFAVLAGASFIAALSKAMSSRKVLLIGGAILIWIVSYSIFGHQEMVIVDGEVVKFWRASDFMNGIATVLLAVGVARKG